MIVVSDTSPIRALAHLELLGLLRDLFAEVLIPPAVDRELRSAPTGLPIVETSGLPFVRVVSVQDRGQVERFLDRLDPGESEALALALEIGADAVLIDEQAGRAVASQLGLAPIGVLGVLLRGKQRGLVATIGPLLDRLESELRFFLSRALRDEVLRLAGES